MSDAYPENGTLIPDEGWHLWIDEHAEWKNDTIFLPEDVDLTKLPTRAGNNGYFDGWGRRQPSSYLSFLWPDPLGWVVRRVGLRRSV